MAKITDAKRNNIIAKWKTGIYTQRDIAKQYKVDVATINKIVKDIPKSNADIVEAQTLLETTKKTTKSQQEIQAINQAVEYRLKVIYSHDNKTIKVYDTAFKILDKVNAILDKGKVPEKINIGDGMQNIEDRELNVSDVEKMANVVDRVSITTKVNERHAPKTEINTQQNNQQTIKRVINVNPTLVSRRFNHGNK